jgi:hypothetical protein
MPCKLLNTLESILRGRKQIGKKTGTTNMYLVRGRGAEVVFRDDRGVQRDLVILKVGRV